MKLLPLFIFWCLWFLNFSSRTIFSPILPLIEDSLSLSHGAAGGLFTSLSIGYCLTLLAAGRLVFSWGYKRTYFFGHVGIALVLLGFGWAESYKAFHLLFFLLGVCSGIYLPCVLPIITQTYEPRHWGKAIGFHETAPSLSIFFIPILVPLGLHLFHWKSLLFFLGVIPLLFLIPFWKVSVEPKHEEVYQRNPFTALFRNRTVWIMGLLWIFSSACSLGIYSILPLYLIKEKSMDFGFANTLLGISRSAGVVVPVMMGFLTDRYRFQAILKWSIFATGLSTVGLALSSTVSSILATLILQALLSLAFFPVAFISISKLTFISDRTMTFGFIMAIGVIFGSGSAPFILGLIADHWSFKAGILGLGVLTALSSFMVRFLERSRTDRNFQRGKDVSPLQNKRLNKRIRSDFSSIRNILHYGEERQP
jgi:NNP family nitrate/nitrite transporter-like MFS transporter